MFRGNTLTIKVKFPDFTQRTRCMTVTDCLMGYEDILPLAHQLLDGLETGTRPFRLLGLSVSNPVDDRNGEDWEQLWLDFGEY